MEKIIYADVDFVKLGNNIKHMRKFMGDTQVDLAQIIDENGNGRISEYERAKRAIPYHKLLKISEWYGVTVDEIIQGDFSFLADKSFAKRKLDLKKDATFIMAKMFPIVYEEQDLQNQTFQKALKLHTNLRQTIIREKDFDESEIDLCIDLYRKASEEGIASANVNLLWWVILTGITVMVPPSIAASLERGSNNIKEIRKDILTQVDFVDMQKLKEQVHTFKQEKRDWQESGSKLIVSLIKSIKQTPIYNRIGDYYLALSYLYSLLDNNLSQSMNATIGRELLSMLEDLGNPYAKRAIKFLGRN